MIPVLPPPRQDPTAALVLSPLGLGDRLQLVDVSDDNLVEGAGGAKQVRLPCAGHRVMPVPLTAQQSALTMSKRRAGSRQEVAAAAGVPAGAKARSTLEGPPWPNAGADGPAGRPAG